MFKAFKKATSGISKAAKKVKGHVKSAAKKTGKALKKKVLDNAIKAGKKLASKKNLRKLTDVITDPDAMGNPLMMGLKLGAPKIYNKINEIKDKGAILAQQFTGIPISDMRNNMKQAVHGAKQALGIPSKEPAYMNPETSNEIYQDQGESEISSVVSSNITNSIYSDPTYNKKKAYSDYSKRVNTDDYKRAKDDNYL